MARGWRDGVVIGSGHWKLEDWILDLLPDMHITHPSILCLGFFTCHIAGVENLVFCISQINGSFVLLIREKRTSEYKNNDFLMFCNFNDESQDLNSRGNVLMVLSDHPKCMLHHGGGEEEELAEIQWLLFQNTYLCHRGFSQPIFEGDFVTIEVGVRKLKCRERTYSRPHFQKRAESTNFLLLYLSQGSCIVSK